MRNRNIIIIGWFFFTINFIEPFLGDWTCSEAIEATVIVSPSFTSGWYDLENNTIYYEICIRRNKNNLWIKGKTFNVTLITLSRLDSDDEVSEDSELAAATFPGFDPNNPIQKLNSNVKKLR